MRFDSVNDGGPEQGSPDRRFTKSTLVRGSSHEGVLVYKSALRAGCAHILSFRICRRDMTSTNVLLGLNSNKQETRSDNRGYIHGSSLRYGLIPSSPPFDVAIITERKEGLVTFFFPVRNLIDIPLSPGHPFPSKVPRDECGRSVGPPQWSSGAISVLPGLISSLASTFCDVCIH
jgi:hypothetical protein